MDWKRKRNISFFWDMPCFSEASCFHHLPCICFVNLKHVHEEGVRRIEKGFLRCLVSSMHAYDIFSSACLALTSVPLFLTLWWKKQLRLTMTKFLILHFCLANDFKRSLLSLGDSEWQGQDVLDEKEYNARYSFTVHSWYHFIKMETCLKVQQLNLPKWWSY